MASLIPFRALRPMPAVASRVAAVPYDVVTTDEARAQAAGNPLSFLHVSRAEIDQPPGTDPHSDSIYAAAAHRFAALKRDAPLVREDEPCLYLYRLRVGAHEQVGLAGCYALDEYDRDIIRKHERTRRDKEDDRTRHMIALRAQTGPVFLTYRASPDIDAVTGRVIRETPLFDFSAPDGVQHTIWRVPAPDERPLMAAFQRVPAVYIADGHHRAASAARARQTLRQQEPPVSAGAVATAVATPVRPFESFLGVAFPDNQVRILPYNRTVKGLNGLAPDAFLDAVRQRFDISSGGASPRRKGEIAMYLAGQWYTLRARDTGPGTGQTEDVIAALDVSVLQERLLDQVLGIRDVRTDPRLEFIGGGRGTEALVKLVDEGQASVAFSMFPVSVADLMAISDAGHIMPPKSTWFDPKLRDGLLIHEI
jgi:uncharacterized protein (DUF1015 family)